MTPCFLRHYAPEKLLYFCKNSPARRLLYDLFVHLLSSWFIHKSMQCLCNHHMTNMFHITKLWKGMNRHDDKAVLCFFCSRLILIAIIFIFIPELTILFQFLCVVFLFCFSPSCVTCVTRLSGLYIFDCLFGIP